MIAIVTQPMAAQRNQKKFSTLFKVLGIFELVLGALSILFGIIAIATPSDHFTFSLLATGIWCGVFFSVTGILAVVSSRSGEPCPIIGGMVMSIFSALAGGTLLGMSVVAAVLSDEKVDFVCHILLCVCGLVAAVVSIIHSSCCCAVTCCVAIPSNVPSEQYYYQNQVAQPFV